MIKKKKSPNRFIIKMVVDCRTAPASGNRNVSQVDHSSRVDSPYSATHRRVVSAYNLYPSFLPSFYLATNGSYGFSNVRFAT